jgi:hypothetical protein
MQTLTQTRSWPARTVWIARGVRALPILFLSMDAIIKLLKLAPAVEATMQLGYPAEIVVGLGVVLLACLALYVLPRTSVLGAILLTGYLGGAVATHVRVGSPVFSLVFPIILGALLWGGLLLQNPRLRALFRSEDCQRIS